MLVGTMHARTQTSFQGPLDLYGIKDKRLNEISGIAPSMQLPNTYWVINDSGDDPNIYCIGADGGIITTVRLVGDTNRDWEDLTIGPGPERGKLYLYVAEIGDNNARAKSIKIHRVEEPRIIDPADTIDVPRSKRDVIECTYPNGAKDAEALMIDPRSRDLYIISKREPRSTIYRLPYPQSTTKSTKLELAGQLPYNFVTAADITMDGVYIAIKTYEHVFVYTRTGTENLLETLRKQPDTAVYMVEPQGEAVCWMRSGKGFVTASEQAYSKVLPHVFGYIRTGAVIPDLEFDVRMPILRADTLDSDSVRVEYTLGEDVATMRAYVTNAMQVTVVDVPLTDGTQGTHETGFSMHALPPGSYLLNLEAGGRYASVRFTRR
jgi:hypothetical protein